MLKIEPHKEFFVQYEEFCKLPFTKVIITSYGEVSHCCHQGSTLGKITKENSILDIWRSNISFHVRNSISQKSLHPVCESANSCPHILGERKKFQFTAYKNFAFPTCAEICLPDKHCNVGGENPTPDNPACIMCKRNWVKPTQPDMTDFICEKVKYLMPYLRELLVLGIAEPFWKGILFDVYKKIEFHNYKHQIRFRTNTNGICLNDHIINRFFEETEWSNMAFSFDATTPETFKKIRRMDVFHQVKKNAANYIKTRELYGGSKHHTVHIWNNINLLNLHEMAEMVEMTREMGFDYIVMLPTYDQQGIVQLGELMLNEKNVGLFRDEAKKAREKADELGIKLIYASGFDLPPKNTKMKPEKLVQISL